MSDDYHCPDCGERLTRYLAASYTCRRCEKDFTWEQLEQIETEIREAKNQLKDWNAKVRGYDKPGRYCIQFGVLIDDTETTVYLPAWQEPDHDDAIEKALTQIGWGGVYHHAEVTWIEYPNGQFYSFEDES